MRITNDLMAVLARALSSPGMKFKEGRPKTPENGAWNFLGQKFCQGACIKRWECLLVFAGDRQNLPSKDSVQVSINRAISEVRKYGIRLPDCAGLTLVRIPNLDDREDVDRKIKAEFMRLSNLNDKKPELVWTIIPSKHPYLKARIKYYGDTKAGIQTMLLQAQNLTSRGFQGIIANEAAKLNLRFGGRCWELNPADLRPLDEKCMVSFQDSTATPPANNL